MSKRWPEGVPVCKHIFWGLVTLTGVSVKWITTLGRDVPLVDVHSDELHGLYHSLTPYADHAWIEHLTPLTGSARAMLAIAKAGAR